MLLIEICDFLKLFGVVVSLWHVSFFALRDVFFEIFLFVPLPFKIGSYSLGSFGEASRVSHRGSEFAHVYLL